MNPLNHSTLGLFLTEKNSLGTWEKAGILSREIAPYNILARYFQKIFIFSYRGENDRGYQTKLAPNITVVSKPKRIPLRYYFWLLPLIHWKKIRQCQFLKTNQFKSRAALLSKIFHPQSKFMLRTGYIPSLFEKQEKGQTSWYLRLRERLAYRCCDRALVTSLDDKKYLIKNYRLPPEKIMLIANYIDTDLFAPQPQTELLNRVVFVGRLSPQKNLASLVRALAGLGLGLDIIGPTEAPEQIKLKEELIRIADQEKISLNFLGTIANEELPSHLNRYPLFVLSSLYEGTPKALLEAMSCGLACIATAITGNKELITHGVNGLLAEPHPESLRTTIKKLAEDSRQRHQLGQAARKFVIDNYSLNSQIKKEITVYESLL